MRINLSSITRTEELMTCKDRFEYRPDLRMRWLQRLCFWILRKLRAYARDSVATYSSVTIDDKVIAGVWKAIKGIRLLGLGVNSRWRVIVGVDAFREICETAPSGPLHFSTPSIPALMGMPITVVPWIEGIALVPPEDFR